MEQPKRTFLLFNTSFRNRGDGLMNLAIEQHFGSKATWAVPLSLMVRSPDQLPSYQIYPDINANSPSLRNRSLNLLAGFASGASGLLPDGARKGLRIAISRDISVAFDVSGYSYGDFWGQNRIENAIKQYRYLRKVGAKIVLMPKTWGPFESISKALLIQMFGEIDIAFARDRKSEVTLRDILDDAGNAKLHLAPDYTHEVKVEPQSQGSGKVYFIPNSRVIDSGTADSAAYMRAFAELRRKISAAGGRSRLLIHEVSNDREFISHAGEMGFADGDVEVTTSAIDAKTRIASASGVVTSRLHGLYNALNTEVPVIVLGWNFKYQEALEKYRVPNRALNICADSSEQDKALNLLFDAVEIAKYRRAVSEGKKESERETERMWHLIDGIIPTHGKCEYEDDQ
jgi:hypothetical protein